MPEVWVRMCHAVMVSTGDRSSGACGAKSGRYVAIGSRSTSEPRSTSCMIAVAVIGLVIEATAVRGAGIDRTIAGPCPRADETGAGRHCERRVRGASARYLARHELEHSLEPLRVERAAGAHSAP
jgi:hypothetical protein